MANFYPVNGVLFISLQSSSKHSSTVRKKLTLGNLWGIYFIQCGNGDIRKFYYMSHRARKLPDMLKSGKA